MRRGAYLAQLFFKIKIKDKKVQKIRERERMRDRIAEIFRGGHVDKL